MSFTRWISNPLGLSPGSVSRRKTPAARPTFRPTLEALEDRWVPSTLTVLNNLDSGAGSLRAEIAAAHNSDTIVFAPSLDGQTITLTSGELLIKHNVTITGPGAGQLAVSGNNASRVFEVFKTLNAVTLSGLTISNGVSIYGGGIFNHATLTVSGSTMSGNSATPVGGGIYNTNSFSATVTVENSSTITGNTAPVGFGADVYNLGVLYLDASSIIGILDGNPAAPI